MRLAVAAMVAAVAAHVLSTDGDVFCVMATPQLHEPATITVRRAAPGAPVPVVMFPKRNFAGLLGSHYGEIEDFFDEARLGALDLAHGFEIEPKGKYYNGFLREEPVVYKVKTANTWCVAVGPSESPIEVTVTEPKPRALPTFSETEPEAPSQGVFDFFDKNKVAPWMNLSRDVVAIVFLVGLWALYTLKIPQVEPSIVSSTALQWVVVPAILGSLVGVASYWYPGPFGGEGPLVLRRITDTFTIVWGWLFAQGYGTLTRTVTPGQRRKIQLYAVVTVICDTYFSAIRASPNHTQEKALTPTFILMLIRTVFGFGRWQGVWRGFKVTKNQITDLVTRSRFKLTLVALVVSPIIALATQTVTAVIISLMKVQGVAIDELTAAVASHLVFVLLQCVPLFVIYASWTVPNLGLAELKKTEEKKA